jgi:hypothetical protein
VIEEVMEPELEIAAPVIEETKPKTRRPRKAKVEAPPVVDESEEGETEEHTSESESE